jgi:2-hydroxychromene-2-carboxylate isomerase
MTALTITHYTDPACPFAFSAEPIRRRLRWHYGEQLVWRNRMIVLTLEPGHAEMLAEGAPGLQRRYGMPIDPTPRARPASSEPACRAVVAARLNAPEAEEPLLRRLRVHAMLGGLLDEPEVIAAAAGEAGLDPAALSRWCAGEEVEQALAADIAAARSPSPAARALDHKLAGPARERRYSAPSYEIADDERGRSFAVPGFNPFEAYETAIANLAPELVRRPRPAGVAAVLEWAGEPLATVEVAAVAQLEVGQARVELARVATPLAAGAGFYWELRSAG